MPEAAQMPKSMTFAAAVSIQAAAGGDSKSLPTFSMTAYTGKEMQLAGWRYPVVVDLAGMSIPSQARPIRLQHDAGQGVGHTDSIRVENGQLFAAGVISRKTTAAEDVVGSGKNGFPWQASIGADVVSFEFLKDGQQAIANGRTFTGPMNIVRKSVLGEISFVDLGADDNTAATVAATATQTIKETPMSQPAAPVQPVTASQDVPPVAAAAPAQTVESVRANAASVAMENARIAAIGTVCAGKHQAIQARAISEGWDRERTELEVLRAERPTPPPAIPAAVIAKQQPAMNTQLLEAACALTLKLEKVEKHYPVETLEAASKTFAGGIGLQELLIEAARVNGWTGRNFRDLRGILRAAFAPMPVVQAADGFSTVDISGILSNIANKFLLEGFFSTEQVWNRVAAIGSVKDFKPKTNYRLIGNDQYELVQPGGTIKHGTLGNEKFTNQAQTYAKLLALDRQALMNDDLGALGTLPRKLGRGSGLKINDVFWTTFLADGSFFIAANANYLTGADTVLGIDGLTKAETAFMDQTDSDGKPIGVMPALMLVPTPLSAMGAQLYKSTEIRDTTASNKYPVANPHAGKFECLVSRYLGNSTYTGYSRTGWYLLASPQDLPVIEAVFLNGQQAPVIEMAEADFDTLGIQMRGYHDFGVALQDPRGGVKSKGAA